MQKEPEALYGAITPAKARQENYVPITVAYTKSERDMLHRCIKQMRGSKFVVVAFGSMYEVWRHRSQVTLPQS